MHRRGIDHRNKTRKNAPGIPENNPKKGIVHNFRQKVMHLH